MNPYKTNIELWEEKTGRRVAPDISNESYVKYGHDAEEYLRELFAIDYPQYQVLYENNNMWLNEKYPFAHASLDGWLVDEDGRKGVLEIKTTNILQSMQKEKWKDRIPDNYYIQVLHYLMVTEFEFALLKAQLKYEHNNGDVFLTTKHYKIERAEVEEDIKYLEDAEHRFYECIINDRQPNLVLPAI
jgi:putative phage-type endonuclease